MSDPIELFGPSTDRSQLSLFGEAEDGGQSAHSDLAPDPGRIRQRLHAVLTQAQGAHSMPWSERDARMWRVVFPQMADWLPEAEAYQLRLAFSEEMTRLEAA